LTEHKGRIALAYAKDGHPVFPCYPGTKEPMTKHGVKDATTDPVQIVAWWKATPNANIGIATGFTFDVLDVDDGGEETLMAHEPISVVAESRTPSGGCHILFKRGSVELRNAVKFAPGLDFRTTGGYIIAPGSETADGRKWEWKSKLNGSPLPDCPQWIIDLIKKGSDGENWKPFELPKLIDEGGRNDLLFREGCRLRAERYEMDVIHSVLVAVNASRCVPPLPADEVRKIADSISNIKPGKSFERQLASPLIIATEPLPEYKAFPLTDLGNAERVIHEHGKDLRYAHAWGRWVCWNGHVWKQDDTGGSDIHQRCEQTIRGMQSNAVNLETKGERQALSEWGFGCESSRKIASMIQLARHLPEVPITPDILDTDPYLLGVANGTIDLRTGEIRDSQREDYITRAIPWNYEPGAVPTRWVQFMDEVTGGDKELARYICKALGYSLTGLTQEHLFFFLYGNTGNNGKSVCTNTIKELFGDYGTQLTPETLMVKVGDGGISNDIAKLKGVRFVLASETEDGKRLNEGLMKRLTGGDPITARFLHQEFFDFQPRFKLWMTGNHKPQIRGSDDAIWRRVALIPFQVTIPAEKRQRDLQAILRTEMSGILNYCLHGCKLYFQEGLEKPKAVTDAVSEYREDSDTIGKFLNECTLDSVGSSVKSRRLYEVYSEWSKRSNEYKHTETRFSSMMRERGRPSAKHRDSNYYENMMLLETYEASTPWTGSND